MVTYNRKPSQIREHPEMDNSEGNANFINIKHELFLLVINLGGIFYAKKK